MTKDTMDEVEQAGEPVAARLEAALARRQDLERELGSGPVAYRLVHGKADGFEGLTIDRYGQALLVEQHRLEAAPGPLIDALAASFDDDRPIFFKRRCSRDEADRAGWQVRGAPMAPELVIEELGLRLNVHLTAGEHTQLFLDARPARALVRREAEGRRVLNLFAYTGGFGLAAAAGGARSTTNVDVRRSALDAARRNYASNQAQIDSRTFMRDDAERFLKRGARGRGRYDLVVVDPPPRSRLPGGRGLDVRRGYAGLIERCLAVIDSGGLLLAGLNARAVGDGVFEAALIEASESRGLELDLLDRIGPGPDFPESTEFPSARFALCKIAGR
jgi:23S rRNA (cytosine1962-C5)-methyltransferase